MSWSPLFPKGCPPRQANAPSGTVYRLVDRASPRAKDFLSHRQRKPEMEYADMCEACGLSVYRSREDVERLRRMTGLTRKKRVAQATVDGAPGRMLATPRSDDSHHTWWLPDENNVWEMFQVVS